MFRFGHLSIVVLGMTGLPHLHRGACQNSPMDIERINQIGGLLADLTARTDALRGYL
jgi:hypothetical protein